MKKAYLILLSLVLSLGLQPVFSQVTFDYFANSRQFVVYEGTSVRTFNFPQKLVYQNHKSVDGRLAIAYQLKETGDQYVGLWNSQLQYMAEYNLGKLEVYDFDLQEDTEDASGLVIVRYFDKAHQSEFAGIFDSKMQWLGQYDLTGATNIKLNMKGMNPSVSYNFKGQDWVAELATNGQEISRTELPPNDAGTLVTVVAWDGKQGMANANGKIVVPCIFDEVFESFQPNVYIAIEGGKWGTVDNNGNKLSGFSYDEIGMFYQGIAKAQKGDKWGFIQSDGKELTDFIYDNAGSFEFGPAKVSKEGKWDFIGFNGQKLNGSSFERAQDFNHHRSAVVMQNGKYALFDQRMNKITGFEFDRIGRFPKVGATLAKVQQNGKWGFIDPRGNMVVPAIYDRVNDFKEGRAAVQKGGKFLFLDGSGKVLPTAEYEKARSFRNGVAQVSKGGKSTLIGLDGKEMLPMDWDRVGFKAGFAVIWSGRKQGLIDKDGSVVIAPSYEMVDIVAHDGNIVGILVKKEGKRGVFSLAANDFSIPLAYEKLYGMAEQGLFMAQLNRSSGLLAPDGKVIAEITYEQIKPINANLIAMKDQGGLWGVIDTKGNKVLGYSYDAIGEEMEGRILLQKGGKVGFADAKGKVVIPVEYADSRKKGFKGGLYPTQVNGKAVFLNKWGKVVE